MSAALRSAWAKSLPRDTTPTHHLPLVQHCEDAGEVAGRLWDVWLPPAVREHFSSHLGADARAVVQWLAASHDVGKLSPAFAWQVGGLADEMRRNGLTFPSPLDGARLRRDAPHQQVSHRAIHHWLASRHGWSGDAAHTVAVVSGGHHGRQPSSGVLNISQAEAVGTGAWEAARTELLGQLADRYGIDAWLGTRTALPQPLQVLATAVVVTCDWIASDHHLFPLVPNGVGFEGLASTEERLERAWRRLDLPGPWQPVEPTGQNPDELLRARFDVPDDAAARPVQVAALEAARDMTTPGLLVIEAPTGEGKTEAALLAAEVLASRFGLGGVAIHLPTTATADAMFVRLLDWLDTLPDDGIGSHDRSLNLLHGRAHLNPTLRSLDRLGGADGISTFDDEAATGEKARLAEVAAVFAVVEAWLQGRHKSSLADFTVGTIDQFLFLALRSKFLPMRHLGAARKVVVLDEVHAVDSYMSVYLEQALAWCGALGVPVVALSATLPSGLRAQLHTAYGAGVAARTLVVPTSGRKRYVPRAEQVQVAPVTPNSDDRPYPVITTSQGADITTTPIAASPRRSTTRLELGADDDASLVALLDNALVDGGSVLVVRNTVSRAQSTYDMLRDRYGADVHLMHSRFVGPHRQANDDWLRTRFGPDSSQRPERAIIVSTQVAEQSLDIDLDLLVTDLAPVDLLLQRIGRLHRHPRPRPAALREARCVVVGVDDWDATPPKPVRGSVMVYGKHLLLRTAAVLRERLTTGPTVTAPDDVAELVEAVYGKEPLGPDSWRAAMDMAAAKSDELRARLRSRAEGHLVDAPRADGQWIDDWVGVGVSVDRDERGAATVRDGEDAIEVIAVRRVDGTLRLLDGIEGCDDVLPEHGSHMPDDVALRIAACTVRLPGYLGIGTQADKLLDALENAGFIEAWQSHPHLRGRLALVLDESQRLTLAGLQFSYDALTGLKCEAP